MSYLSRTHAADALSANGTRCGLAMAAHSDRTDDLLKVTCARCRLMSKPRKPAVVHLAGPRGLAICSRPVAHMVHDPAQVTCKACKSTFEFQLATGALRAS